MTKDELLILIQNQGLEDAKTLQQNAESMTGTEMYAAEDQIPDFAAACTTKNMLQRNAGFTCRSTAGRVVRLLQPYNSETYPAEPEELPAQWGFKWSTDPKKALPFISLATSPYDKDDCCTYEGHVWRSGQAGNVWAPGTVNVKWDDLGTVEEVTA